MIKSIFNSELFATRFLFTGPVLLRLMFLFSFHTAISSVLPHCSNAQSISHSLHIKTWQDLWFVVSVPSVLSVPYVLSVVFLSRDSCQMSSQISQMYSTFKNMIVSMIIIIVQCWIDEDDVGDGGDTHRKRYYYVTQPSPLARDGWGQQEGRPTIRSGFHGWECGWWCRLPSLRFGHSLADVCHVPGNTKMWKIP